jgi:hypothetical protein
MYPGTYQPLQAVSLLLADLLQRPNSDEAELSRGLVDCVFDQYQVDEGLVSHNNPPNRRLSPLGRDAWSMLARTRKKVLEQLGEDHHVLIPSSVPRSDICICGERIARNQRDIRPEEGDRVEPAETFESTVDLSEIMNNRGLSPVTVMGNADFNWEEWDATVGASIGFVS